MEEKALLEHLEQALTAERDGFHLYTMASKEAKDPVAKELFSRLAGDERDHYEHLQRQYRSILDGAGWQIEPSLEARGNEEPNPHVFTERLMGRIRGSQVAMSALSIGIQLERSAMAFYAARAEEATDEAVAVFFRGLAAWENDHYQLLLAQEDALREEYWQENRFAPLL